MGRKEVASEGKISATIFTADFFVEIFFSQIVKINLAKIFEFPKFFQKCLEKF